MKTTLNAVTTGALTLTTDDQALLAEKFVRSLASRVPTSIKRKQLAEVVRRRAAVLTGKVKGVSLAQVVREIEALLA
jgi:putative addiction module component (TIGR02574 family)